MRQNATKTKSPNFGKDEHKQKTKFVAGSPEHKAALAKPRVSKGEPKLNAGDHPKMEKLHKTFAQIIRHETNNGYEMIEAVLDVFRRARDREDDMMTMVAATWLTDRGFGKPVQVTQLTDEDGKTLAFTLWQPAAPIDQTDAQIVEALPAPRTEPVPVKRAPPPILPPYNYKTDPAYVEPEDRAYVKGLASDWAKEEKPGLVNE